MLEKIIDWSIRNKFMDVLVTIFVVVGGVYALKNIPLDAIPDLSDVHVIVYTEYPGQAPQVVEDHEYKCRRCGKKKTGPRSIHAHHIKPWAGNQELRFDIDNAVTLCRSCHEWVHSNENLLKEWL